MISTHIYESYILYSPCFFNDLIWETETRFVRTLESIMSSMSHYKHDKNGPPTFKGRKRGRYSLHS